MRHYNSIKQLFPLDLGELSDLDMEIEGRILDSAQGRIDAVLSELFASTSILTIARWEAEYGVVPTANSTVQERRSTVVAKIVQISALKRGGLSKAMFVTIAAAMGYQIQIADTLNLFRAGISRAGDAAYAAGELWVMVVNVLNASTAPDLENTFTDIRPPYLRLEFIYG